MNFEDIMSMLPPLPYLTGLSGLTLGQLEPYGTLYSCVRKKFDEWRPLFESLPLNERFSFLYNFVLSKNLFPKIKIESTKSTDKAVAFKKRGNEVFRRENFLEAVRQYTRSIAFVEPNSKELAIAFANRSAALLRLKRYEACLVDINRALKENHPDLPEEWKQKLLDRKRNCLSKLREYYAAEMNSLVSLSSSTIDDDTLEDWIRRRKDECQVDENATDMNNDQRFYVPSGNLKNPLIPNASKKLKINYSEEWGRHMIATEDIKPGELLHIEKPYAAILKFNFGLYFNHCSYCFIRCEALIPCRKCSNVMYCSVRCRNDAYDRYHRVECSILPTAMKFGEEEPAWLALRILLMETNQGEKLETILNNPEYKEPMKNSDPTVLGRCESDFMHVYNLSFSYDRPEGHWHPTCINAVLILYILKHSAFFAPSNSKNVQINHEILTDVESYVGNLLFRLISIMPCNGKPIIENYEKVKLNSIETVCESMLIGYGLYPFVSFYNHSCDENVFIAFHKNTVVCHATQPIEAGKQLFVDYCMFHHETARHERLSGLQKEYFFTCQCEMCENDWPSSEHFDGPVQAYQLIDDANSVNLRELYQMGFAFYEWQEKRPKKNAHSAKLLQLVCDYTSIFGKIVRKPCHDYYECQREIRQIFNERANYYLLARDKVLIFL